MMYTESWLLFLFHVLHSSGHHWCSPLVLPAFCPVFILEQGSGTLSNFLTLGHDPHIYPSPPTTYTLSNGSTIVTATCQSHHPTWKESFNSTVLLGQSHFSPFENYSCLCAFYLLISKVLSLKATTLCVDSTFSFVYLSIKGLPLMTILWG